jgi:thiol:disulfide interchange protein DsbD
MRLDRDDFIIAYDGSVANDAKIMATIKEAGYASRVATGQIGKPIDRSGQASEKLPRMLVEALATAKREHKPVVLDFYAQWCAPCKRMLTETFGDSKVSRLLKECIVVKIDTDHYPEVARKFGVEGLPDIRFLADDGSEKQKLLDYQDAASFAKALAELLNSPRQSRQR